MKNLTTAIFVTTFATIGTSAFAIDHDLIKCGEYTLKKSQDFPEELVDLEYKSRNYRDYKGFLIKYLGDSTDSKEATFVFTKDEDLTSRLMSIPVEQRQEILKEVMIKEDKKFIFRPETPYGPQLTEYTGYNGSVIVRGDYPEWQYSRGLGDCKRVFRSGGLYSERVSSEANRVSYRGADFKKVTYKGFEGFKDEFGNIWGDLVQREGEPMALPHSLATKYCESKGAKLPNRYQMVELFIQLADENAEKIYSFRDLTNKVIERKTSDGSTEVLPGLEFEEQSTLPFLMEDNTYQWNNGFYPSKLYGNELGHFRCVKRQDFYN